MRLLRPLLVVIGLIVLVPGGGLAQDRPLHPLLADPADTVRVQLVDRASGRPITDSEVEVYSDNGIRCVTTPCPTNGRSWHGRTDADGVVALPRTAIDAVSHLGTPTHGMTDLARARKSRAGVWVLRLARGR